MMRMRSRLHGPIAVITLVGAFLIASCSASPTPAATSKTQPTAMKPYGSLMIAADLSLADMGLLRSNVNSFDWVSSAIFDPLVYYDAAGSLKPGIAERWEISPDGKSHTFYIRKGVKFHNGDDLTGADVKFSIERMMGPGSGHSDVTLWRGAVASVELKDEYTVVLHLKQPQFGLLRASDNAMAAALPKKYLEDKGVDYFSRNPVGSGPWKVVRYAPGDRLELEAVDDHWRTVPKFKNLTLLHLKEEATKVAMLKTGELDLADITPESVPGLKSAGLRVADKSSGSQYFAVLFYDPDNPEKYAFGNVKVRKALQLAVNSQEIADEILGGYGKPYAFYGPDPTTAYFWDSNVLKVDPYDPEQAKKLLAEAGYSNGFDTTLYDTGGGGLVSTLNQAISGYWRKVGVNSQVIPMTRDAHRPLFSPKTVPQVWNTVYVGLGSPTRDFDKMVSSYHSTGTFKNIKNPKLDELIVKVPTIADPSERKKLALQAVVMAKDEYVFVKIATVPTLVAFGGKVGEVELPISAGLSAFAFETITHAK